MFGLTVVQWSLFQTNTGTSKSGISWGWQIINVALAADQEKL